MSPLLGRDALGRDHPQESFEQRECRQPDDTAEQQLVVFGMGVCRRRRFLDGVLPVIAFAGGGSPCPRVADRPLLPSPSCVPHSGQ
ncbi:hypothetical protein [Halovenus salina]|uniref:Uncharacterized protein n=1 Tax=Halovenus salina TaxID=1510225 RepID=A0ABD5W490_9EURY